jgi:hypothetical protein
LEQAARVRRAGRADRMVNTESQSLQTRVRLGQSLDVGELRETAADQAEAGGEVLRAADEVSVAGRAVEPFRELLVAGRQLLVAFGELVAAGRGSLQSGSEGARADRSLAGTVGQLVGSRRR